MEGNYDLNAGKLEAWEAAFPGKTPQDVLKLIPDNSPKFSRREFINGAPKGPPADLQKIAHLVLKELPPQSGFVVIAFPLDGSSKPRYCSNGSRESVLKLLKDFVEKQSV